MEDRLLPTSPIQVATDALELTVARGFKWAVMDLFAVLRTRHSLSVSVA